MFFFEIQGNDIFLEYYVFDYSAPKKRAGSILQ